MTLLSIHSSNNPIEIGGFEKWLGRPVDLISQHTGESSLQDFTNSPGYFARAVVDASQRPAIWSVPLVWAGTTLSQVASGVGDDAFRAVAKVIATNRPKDRIIYLRTGWEFNGNWMKWASRGQEKQFVIAFQRFATVFRRSSHRFRVIWCPNIGQQDPELSYPGNDFVDVIGMDFYHQPWDPQSPLTAWQFMRSRSYGLDWLTEFAARQQKPLCIPEWGVRSDGLMLYVSAVAHWCNENKVLFHSYWDSDAAYPGRLSEDRNPGTGAAFRAAFRHF